MKKKSFSLNNVQKINSEVGTKQKSEHELIIIIIMIDGHDKCF